MDTGATSILNVWFSFSLNGLQQILTPCNKKINIAKKKDLRLLTERLTGCFHRNSWIVCKQREDILMENGAVGFVGARSVNLDIGWSAERQVRVERGALM